MGLLAADSGAASAGGDTALASRLAVLHALRCVLGPLVESLILRDRAAWVRETLAGAAGMRVELVNLFDQASGSARNVAIVVAPGAGQHVDT